MTEPEVRRIAVYAGTFDPPTLGHLSVVERAARVFDHVIVLCAVNPTKIPLFSPEERIEMWRDAVADLPNVSCDFTADLVVNYARQTGARFLVRGIRGATDADYEAALAHANRALAPEILTIFLPADPRLSEVSSSGIKQMVAFGQDVAAYCTPRVAERLRQRIRRRLPPRREEARG